MSEHKIHGMSVERLLATFVAELLAPSYHYHSAPCVRVPWTQRSAFETALVALRDAGLFVVVISDVAVYWSGLVRVHRVHISNDLNYLQGFVNQGLVV